MKQNRHKDAHDFYIGLAKIYLRTFLGLLCAYAQKYKYAGMQMTKRGSLCMCGNKYGKHGKSNQCNKPCPTDKSQTCGGFNANTIVTIKGKSLNCNHTRIFLLYFVSSECKQLGSFSFCYFAFLSVIFFFSLF